MSVDEVRLLLYRAEVFPRNRRSAPGPVVTVEWNPDVLVGESGFNLMCACFPGLLFRYRGVSLAVGEEVFATPKAPVRSG